MLEKRKLVGGGGDKEQHSQGDKAARNPGWYLRISGTLPGEPKGTLTH